MIRYLVGHRGVGKSSLLKRLRNYFPDQQFFDLDQELGNISNLFMFEGEARFRELEHETLKNILAQIESAWICLGAGFELEKLPRENCEIIWVRRPSDSLGRVFFDRPRLNPKVSQIDEYQIRFQNRQNNFSHMATWIYDLPDGLTAESSAEKYIFENRILAHSASVTVFNTNFDRIADWRIANLELRDDLGSPDLVLEVLDALKRNFAKEKILFSFRNKTNLFSIFEPVLPPLWDWPAELGQSPRPSPILSLHDREEGDSLDEVIQKFEALSSPQQHLKLAVEIRDFTELRMGIEWQQQSPASRSFLPRSQEGRWAWVRLWLKSRQKINFLREGKGSSADQPTLWQWLVTPEKPKHFAAVVGDPVAYSRSPIFHHSFFSNVGVPFWAVQVKQGEWDQAFPVLEKMGLIAAAVTAPLKLKVGGNTLWKESDQWQTRNTDTDGFRALMEKLPENEKESVIVWGGGGTLQSIRDVLPKARFFSMRTGLERETNMESPRGRTTLIWAAGPEASPPSQELIQNQNLEWVVDLNYREDSRAREFAIHQNAKYLSGDEMFRVQAIGQQFLWQGLKRSLKA